MWPFRKKLKQRRLEVRRNIPADTTSWAWIRRPGGLASVLIAGVFYVAAMAMLLWPLDPLGYRAGQYVPQDVISRVSLEVLDEKDLAARIERARKSRPAMVRLDEGLLDEIVAGLRALPEQYTEAASRPATREAATSQPGRRGPELPVERLREELVKVCFVKGKPSQAQWDMPAGKVFVNSPPPRRMKDPSVLVYLDNPDDVGRALDELVKPVASPMRQAVADYLRGKLRSDRPLYAYDEAGREKWVAQEIEQEKLHPPTKNYPRGWVLVPGSDVHGLDEEGLKLLRLEHEKYLSAQRGWGYLWSRLVGRSVLPLLATVLLCMYIGKYQPRLARNTWRGAALAGVGLLMLGLARGMVLDLGLHPYSAVAPVIAAALIMTIVYGQRFAFVFSGFLSLLIVLQLRGDLTTITVLLVGATGAIVRLHEVRTRSRLIEVGARQNRFKDHGNGRRR